MIERPLDALNKGKGKSVMVELKNGRRFRGTLLAFDIHINLVLQDVEELDENLETKRKFGLMLIRGDTVLNVVVE